MDDFTPKSICILGRQPAFGKAELEGLYGDRHTRPLAGAALLDLPAEKIEFNKLGGTVKTTKLLAELPSTNWPELVEYLAGHIPEHLGSLKGKLTLGLSLYGFSVTTNQIHRALLQIKKIIKKSGRPVRVVLNNEPALSSAQVLHNKLTHKGGWELVLIKDGRQTYLAQTVLSKISRLMPPETKPDQRATLARECCRPNWRKSLSTWPPA